MKVALSALLVAFLTWLAYLIAFHTVPPSTQVTIEREPSGYRFDFEPNFVVNHIYRIEIYGPGSELLYESPKTPSPQPGPKQVTLVSDLKSGTEVKVRCSMQYDRFVACGTQQEEWLRLP